MYPVGLKETAGFSLTIYCKKNRTESHAEVVPLLNLSLENCDHETIKLASKHAEWFIGGDIGIICICCMDHPESNVDCYTLVVKRFLY
jgi:hypothetical protein